MFICIITRQIKWMDGWVRHEKGSLIQGIWFSQTHRNNENK